MNKIIYNGQVYGITQEIIRGMIDDIFDDQNQSNQEQEDEQNGNVQSGENVSP